MQVVTRFAPSPTGMLHIGGARTALFNYLFARRMKGDFLLRIEDTDRERSTGEAAQAILDGMRWLSLDPDKPPVFQSKNAARHAEVAQEMIERGHAFRCYMTPEELQQRRDRGEALREQAKAPGVTAAEQDKLLEAARDLLAPFRSPWRDGGKPPAENSPYTVRLRAPDARRREVTDKVLGTIEIGADELDDMVLLRSDATPTYMLAVVVDDHDMGVTHVIRGDDHLRNTFRQVPIFEAMNWPVPVYAHLPMIHGPDGAKLSKRHGAMSVLAYRDLGYLPEGLKAYLLRLGWSHGDKEVFTDEEAIAVFDLEGINRAPARIDFEKLAAVNGQFIRDRQDEDLIAALEPFLASQGPLTESFMAQLKIALPQMKGRGNTLIELAAAFEFLRLQRPIDLNAQARKALKPESTATLAQLLGDLEGLALWTTDTLESALKNFVERQGITMGAIGPALRAALTGGRPAPELKFVLYWLGREEVIGRISDQLSGTNQDTETEHGTS